MILHPGCSQKACPLGLLRDSYHSDVHHPPSERGSYRKAGPLGMLRGSGGGDTEMLGSGGPMGMASGLLGGGGSKEGGGGGFPKQEILIQSVTETIVPKLVADDVPLPSSLLADVFPGIKYSPSDLDELKAHICAVAAESHLVVGDVWFQKVLQLYQIQNIQQVLMMFRPSATGKTQAWRVLLAALQRLEGREGVSYVIDPKAISKDSLYDDIMDASIRTKDNSGEVPDSLITQQSIIEVLSAYFQPEGLITGALQFATGVNHIMEFTVSRALSTLFSLINKTIRNVLDYNTRHNNVLWGLGAMEKLRPIR
ncbi:uncharacterized protein VP01_2881g6 [Puccinia sorghi]|uniref:Dynein heavy chain hydrolytic ATP-binding dynein motor region domain-containing protein n=1 Tax=Puccinia sorghi TaxID=27349 RepID=A0A0L6V2G2_9BASI|nr:uncharacterized protein VP01_2881g6 [Puccinia sorghi]